MAAARKAGGAPALPAFNYPRLEAATALLARIIDENAEGIAKDALRYSAALRDSSGRPLEPGEAMHIAAAYGEATDEPDPVALAERLQSSSLRAHDAVALEQSLGRALAGRTVPLTRNAIELLALIEMPKPAFSEAWDNETLDQAVSDAAFEIRNSDASVGELKDRAHRAVLHITEELGQTAGEAVSLFANIMTSLADRVADRLNVAATSSSLTGSPEPTDAAAESSTSTGTGRTS